MAASVGFESSSANELFNRGFEIYAALLDGDDPTSSSNYQEKLKNGIQLLEKATREVSLLDMFSRNETVEEVATSDLKFFLLPALLGSLTLRLTIRDRNEVLEASEVYLKDFLSRCKLYGIIFGEFDLEKPYSQSAAMPESLMASAQRREEKMRRYKAQQELDNNLRELKMVLERPNAEEEFQRNYYLTLIRKHCLGALEDLDGIESEKPLVQHMARLTVGKDEEGKEKLVRNPLKPVILTKNEAQKKVFGIGYPGVPVMSVEEFYDQRVKAGIFPAPSHTPRSLQDMANDALRASAAQEYREAREEEQDDPAALQQARDFDDWKDTHKRGYGNRYNRS